MESHILKEIIEIRVERIKDAIEFNKTISEYISEGFMERLIINRNIKMGNKTIWDIELASELEMLESILNENDLIIRKTNELINSVK